MLRHQTKRPEYAGGLVRLLAVIIDTIVLLPVHGLTAAIFQDHLLFMLCSNLILSGLYYVIFLSGRWQATLGKRLLNIYVISQDGEPISQKLALERYLAYIMPTLPLYSSFSPETTSVLVLWLMIAWFFPVLLSEQKAGLHDLICKTRVVTGKK